MTVKNRSQFTGGSSTAAMALLLLLAGTSPAAAGQNKVTICHIPPGNPSNFQDIVIAESALAAHIRQHGDFVGSCKNNCKFFGSLCDDHNPCTVDRCDVNTGKCLAPVATDCIDNNPCTADACDTHTGACVYTPLTTGPGTCSDGYAFTEKDACTAGTCAGTLIAGACKAVGDCSHKTISAAASNRSASSVNLAALRSSAAASRVRVITDSSSSVSSSLSILAGFDALSIRLFKLLAASSLARTAISNTCIPL